jgi:benzodiazapine receptor
MMIAIKTQIPGSAAQSSVSDLRLAVLAFVVVAAPSVAGQIATYPNLTPWYAGLQKPSFNPPNWLFAPVWTTLFVLMAFALWRILRAPASQPRRIALSLFLLQLALNAVWSLMFFAAHSPILGLLDIVPQLAIIVATIIAFYRLDRLAAWCLVPLAAWVAFATVLNVSIWRLN